MCLAYGTAYPSIVRVRRLGDNREPNCREILNVHYRAVPLGSPETPLIVDSLAHPWPTHSPGSVKAGTPRAALAGVMSSGRASTSGSNSAPLDFVERGEPQRSERCRPTVS